MNKIKYTFFLYSFFKSFFHSLPQTEKNDIIMVKEMILIVTFSQLLLLVNQE